MNMYMYIVYITKIFFPFFHINLIHSSDYVQITNRMYFLYHL